MFPDQCIILNRYIQQQLSQSLVMWHEVFLHPQKTTSPSYPTRKGPPTHGKRRLDHLVTILSSMEGADMRVQPTGLVQRVCLRFTKLRGVKKSTSIQTLVVDSDKNERELIGGCGFIPTSTSHSYHIASIQSVCQSSVTIIHSCVCKD